MQSMNWNDLIKQAENAGGGEPIPGSDYPVVVASCEAKASSTGKPMLKVKAKVEGGPYDGRTLWNNQTLSIENDNAVAIFMRQMAAFGLDATYFAQNPSFEQVAIDLVGRRAIYKVTVGSYQGRAKNEVDDVKPLVGLSVGGPPPSPAGVGVPNIPPVPVAPQAAPGSLPVPVPQPAPVPTAPAPPAVPAPPAAPAPVPAPAPTTPAPAAPQPVPTASEPETVSSTPAPPAPPF